MGYSMPSLVRFEQLLDPIKITIFENQILEIIANFRRTSLLFPRQAIPEILSVLDSSYTGDTPCQV